MILNHSTEIGQFQEFLVTRAEDGHPLQSLDEAVDEFREYQRQLTDLKEKLQIGLEQCENGKVAPLDAEQTKQKLRERLAKKGIQ